MKARNIVITIIVVGIVCLLGSTAMADEWEVVGGYLYSTMDPEDLNQTFDQIDDLIYLGDLLAEGVELYLDLELEDDIVDITYQPDYIDDIEEAQGYYLGISRTIDDSSPFGDRVTLQYEKYYFGNQGGVKGNINLIVPRQIYLNNGPIMETEEVDIEFGASLENQMEMDALALFVSSKVNDNVAINTGLGYYSGYGEVNLESNMNVKVDDDLVDEDEYNKTLYKIDLEDNFGWLLGATYNQPIAEGITFTASANYRRLVMDISVEETNEDFNYILLPNKDDFPEEEDFSGLELNIGIAAEF